VYRHCRITGSGSYGSRWTPSIADFRLITGPTGIGKSWLASAFVQSACRHGYTAMYVRAPRLLHDLAVSRGDGSYGRLLAKLAKLDLLAIDDWLLAPLTDAERRDLLEVLGDRSERTSTLIASQLPPTLGLVPQARGRTDPEEAAGSRVSGTAAIDYSSRFLRFFMVGNSRRPYPARPMPHLRPPASAGLSQPVSWCGLDTA